MTERVDLTIDGDRISAPGGATILQACREIGVEIPTICQLDTLTPANACRVCVVEVDGSRPLVPACSRPVSEGMVVTTTSARVAGARRMVVELLASSVDLDHGTPELLALVSDLGARPDRHVGDGINPPARVDEPVRRQDDLYVRDYSRCVLCYKCVEACGEDAQHTFAISVAGRGFDARISTEFDVTLPESACVYCGNCVDVCPTGALVFTPEHELRATGEWDPGAQEVTRTVCPYCGVGCNLELRVQSDTIVGVTSPQDHSVTSGHLCIKGRFGYQFVGSRADRRDL
jgi:predicted molibdopterin-dependent oxidoreductase YjgC